MSNLKIEWLSDSSDCETCGSAWAGGAVVTDLDSGNVVLELLPIASCFGGDDWSESDVFRELLKVLGHTVQEI